MVNDAQRNQFIVTLGSDGIDVVTASAQDLDEATLSVDGAEPLSAELIARVSGVCDLAESAGRPERVVLHVSGAPDRSWTGGAGVALVNRWERVLRRLERLPLVTIAVVDGDAGGAALDALLVADYRLATSRARLVVATDAGSTWPGMALFRLVKQSSVTASVRRAALFGDPIDARLAFALALVDEVTDDLPGALARAAEKTAAFSGPELAIRRQLLLDAGCTSYDEALGAHLAACDRALRKAGAAA